MSEYIPYSLDEKKNERKKTTKKSKKEVVRLFS